MALSPISFPAENEHFAKCRSKSFERSGSICVLCTSETKLQWRPNAVAAYVLCGTMSGGGFLLSSDRRGEMVNKAMIVNPLFVLSLCYIIGPLLNGLSIINESIVPVWQEEQQQWLITSLQQAPISFVVCPGPRRTENHTFCHVFELRPYFSDNADLHCCSPSHIFSFTTN